MKRRLYLAAALLGLCTVNLWAQDDPAPPPARPRDIVRKADGKIMTNIVVVEETPTEVKLDTTGNGKPDTTLDQNDVRAIQYDQEPNDYSRALALYRVRSYDDAMTTFRKAKALPRVRKWVKNYSDYYIAMCLARKSVSDPRFRTQAVKAFQDLLKTGKNRWRDDARYQLGQIQLEAGDRAGAKSAFEELARSAHREEMKLTAGVGLGALWMAEGKAKEALARYDTVVSGAKGKFGGLYVTATVGKAEAHTVLGEYKKAENFLEGILEGEKNKDLRAKAHVALGDCYYVQAAAADEKGAPALYKNALVNYLWVVVVYSSQKAEFAKSLYYAGECWKKLGETAKALELHKELRRKFPATKWGKKVRGR